MSQGKKKKSKIDDDDHEVSRKFRLCPWQPDYKGLRGDRSTLTNVTYNPEQKPH